MKPKIWLSSPHMGGKEIEYVKQAFDTNWIAPLGPHVDGFEKEISEKLGRKVHVAALSSGTAALHLALVILGVKAGDEVITGPFASVRNLRDGEEIRVTAAPSVLTDLGAKK